MDTCRSPLPGLLAALAHGVRQDLILTASDGATLAWQQVCTRRGDTVEIELVRLDPDSERGHDRGSLNFRNFLLWCENAGISKVTLDAGKSVGGYFWARCGFLPDAKSWQRLCRAWRQQTERAGAADLLALLENAMDLGPVGLVFIANSHYGKSLLLHAHWRGLLNLTNPELHYRARQYVVPSPR